MKESQGKSTLLNYKPTLIPWCQVTSLRTELSVYGAMLKDRSISPIYGYGVTEREDILTRNIWIHAHGQPIKKIGQHYWEEVKGHLMPQVTADCQKTEVDSAAAAPLKMPYSTLKTTNLSTHLGQFPCLPIIRLTPHSMHHRQCFKWVETGHTRTASVSRPLWHSLTKALGSGQV